ncbi:MAG: D-glycero-alpha-D-manno-heptose-1,7-bisphosphate 7-phosphatase, partial [Planctomycetaceae bacterium]
MHRLNDDDNADCRRAVFLDRDGTLIEDRGHIRRPADVRFFPDSTASLWRLQQDYLLFIVSNQAGVAEGALTSAEVEEVNTHVVKQLAGAGVTIAEVFWCPHKRSDNCNCIKPQPYVLLQAAEKYRVDLQQSYVIGDHPCDVELAENAGARGIYVLTGHGRKHCRELTGNVLVVAGIAEAAEWIMHEQATT